MLIWVPWPPVSVRARHEAELQTLQTEIMLHAAGERGDTAVL